MKLLRNLACVLLAALFPALPGCPGSGKTKVAFITNNPDPFWSICEAGARKAAEENNVELIFLRPPTNSVKDQKDQIEAARARGVAVISVSVIDATGQREYLDSVADSVPLLCVDNDLAPEPKPKRLCYLGTDNIKAGRSLGELVEKALPNGGTIAFFVGNIESANGRERWQGTLQYLAEVEKKKNIKFKQHGNGPQQQPFLDGGARDKAKENAMKVLGDLDGVPDVCLLGLWNSDPPGILGAVTSKDEGKLLGKIKICGFDENPDTLAGIRAGHIDGTVVQDPYGFGYESVKLMAKIAAGDRSAIPANGIIAVPHKVITRDNVDTFEKDLKAKMGTK
jgi:ribose transport system substrate-binding protein